MVRFLRFLSAHVALSAKEYVCWRSICGVPAMPQFLCVMCRDAKDHSGFGSDEPLVSKATEMSVPIIRIRMSSLKGVMSKAVL